MSEPVDIVLKAKHDCCTRWWELCGVSDAGVAFMQTHGGSCLVRCDADRLARLRRLAEGLGLRIGRRVATR